MEQISNGRFIQIFFAILLLLTGLQSCKTEKDADNSFTLDQIKYEINDGGVGYDVNTDNSLNPNKTSFIVTLHVTNLSSNKIILDSSNFKLTDENGIPVSLKTKWNDTDISNMYKQEIDPGKFTDFMLTYSVPNDGHYDLHIISPVSKTEMKVHY